MWTLSSSSGLHATKDVAYLETISITVTIMVIDFFKFVNLQMSILLMVDVVLMPI
jgi:hypothetical protein